MENKVIYEVGIHKQWWDEFNEDNWTTAYQLFTDDPVKAKEWFEKLSQRKFISYDYQYVFIKKILLDKESSGVMIKQCNIKHMTSAEKEASAI